jgi:hypothetical protein
VARRPEAEQTLLQPDIAPDVVPPKVRLPEFIFLSGELRKPDPVARKKVIIPGRKDPVIQQPVLTAEPTMSPVMEGANSGLTKLASVLNPTAKLQVPAARSAPIRVFKAPPQRPAATSSIDLLPGDSSTVIALHPNPAAMSPLVVVPGGNQIGRLPPGIGGDYGKVTATGKGAGAGESPGGNGTGAGTATGGANGTRSGSGTDPAMPAGSGGASMSGTIAGSSEAPLPSIRQVHPDNGVFDVVVAHPSSPPDGPGGKPLLKGMPVYTVYLNVGRQAEWILRYCVPGSAPRTSAGGNIVQLGNPAPVTPPYPRTTVAPSLDGSRDKMAILHGFLTVQGQFRSLEAVLPEDQTLLSRMQPLLSEWSFRPATRDGVPIEIEILLLLPRLLM